jgi:hypothetical protein
MTRLILLRAADFGGATIYNELPATEMRIRTISKMLTLAVDADLAALLDLRIGDAIGFVIEEDDLKENYVNG